MPSLSSSLERKDSLIPRMRRLIMLASLAGMVQGRTRDSEKDIVPQTCERAKHVNSKQEQ